MTWRKHFYQCFFFFQREQFSDVIESLEVLQENAYSEPIESLDPPVPEDLDPPDCLLGTFW